jgi:DNA-binding transcriptional ArsR family regulator
MDLESMQANADEAASVIKTLANPSRLMVLCALVTREHTAGELEHLVGLSQSALSQHLARLRKQGIVKTRREAQKIYYSLGNDHVRKIVTTMHDLYCRDLE